MNTHAILNYTGQSQHGMSVQIVRERELDEGTTIPALVRQFVADEHASGREARHRRIEIELIDQYANTLRNFVAFVDTVEQANQDPLSRYLVVHAPDSYVEYVGEFSTNYYQERLPLAQIRELKRMFINA